MSPADAGALLGRTHGAEIRDCHGVARTSGLRVRAWSYHMRSLESSWSTASGIFCATVMMVA